MTQFNLPPLEEQMEIVGNEQKLTVNQQQNSTNNTNQGHNFNLSNEVKQQQFNPIRVCDQHLACNNIAISQS